MSVKKYEFDEALYKQAKLTAELILDFPGVFDLTVRNLAEGFIDLLERRGLPPTLKCHPSIQLVSGGYFDFSNVEASPISSEDIGAALAKISRCNGHTAGDGLYSVAQHCFHAWEVAAPEFKFEALMHDAAEYVCGDMTTPLKQLCPDYKRIIKEVEDEIAFRFFLPEDMSPEVKIIDRRLAATERRDVMPVGDGDDAWESLEGAQPYDFKITPWDIPTARQKWLDAFNATWPEHQKRFRDAILLAHNAARSLL